MHYPTPLSQAQKRMLVLSSLGGVLEFYDFIIYIFLAPFIEILFFASSSPYVATLKTLAIFSIGYLFRPLGGVVFSHFGDRYGRKTVFLLTVIFMAVPAFGMGLLPTTAQIGVAAPLLLLLLRMLQGIALGGEIPAAITFIAEHIPNARRGLALSILFFGVNAGLLLGSLVTTLLTLALTQEAIVAYGWRIPFLLGGLFGLLAIFLRRHLQETAAFKAIKAHEVQRVPLLMLLQQYRKSVLSGMSLVATGSATVFFYLYWPQYLHQQFKYPLNQLMLINTAATLLLNGVILLGGWWTDQYGARKIYLLGCSTLLVTIFPLFWLFGQGLLSVIISYTLFTVLFWYIPGSYSKILSQLFPTPIRYTGIAMSYNLAFAFVGGLSPVICTYLIHALNTPFAPAGYLFAVVSLSWLGCYFLVAKDTESSLLNAANAGSNA